MTEEMNELVRRKTMTVGHRRRAAIQEEIDLLQEALDPVGQGDADIDNDGDTDSSDRYLHKRRKAIKKSINKDKEDSVKEAKKSGRKFTAKEVKMATGIAKQHHDQMTDAYERIEKIAPGLSDHPSVARALKAYNESVVADVEHSEWGVGECMSQLDGFVDVLFEHGVERNLKLEDLEILEYVPESYDHLEDALVESLEEKKENPFKKKSDDDEEEEKDDDEEEARADDDEYEDDADKDKSKKRKMDFAQKEETDLTVTGDDTSNMSVYVNAITKMGESVTSTTKQSKKEPKQTSNAAPPESVDVERELDGKKIKKLHRDNVKDDETDEKGHDEALKAAGATKQASARNGDNLKSGDRRRNEEVEQVDELSKKTLGSYTKKAAKSARATSSLSRDFERDADYHLRQKNKALDRGDKEGAERSGKHDDSNMTISKVFKRKADNRVKGIGRAVDRLTKK